MPLRNEYSRGKYINKLSFAQNFVDCQRGVTIISRVFLKSEIVTNPTAK